MRLSELQNKKIVSLLSGRNLGNIMDVFIDETGKVQSLIIEHSKNLFSLNRDGDTQIFWDEITKIGEDVILVKKE